MSLLSLSPRPASVVAVAFASAIMVGACSSAGAAPTPRPSAAASAGSAGAPIDGWPMPGQTTTTSFIPVLASAENVVGDDRFLLTLVDRENRPIASPDRAVTLKFYDLAADAVSPTETVAADFVWAIEGERGFYVAPATFDRAGEWGVEVNVSQSGAAPEAARVRFEVQQKGTTVAVGEQAPSVATPTLADVGGDPAKLSTDPKPDPDLYRTSLAAALAAHEPFVLVFATPAFCQSRVCGPTLETVKRVKAGETGVTFINVEPYTLEWKSGSLQPVLDANGQLSPVPAVNAYGLLVEPWIFVVDRDGVVRASFEAVVSEKELKAAIGAVK
jgi:hypothetical protein